MNRKMIALEFYSKAGLMTDPGEQIGMLANLPNEINDLCRVVQGVMLHVHWFEHYGYSVPKERMEELQIRDVNGMLKVIKKLDNRQLIETRSVEKKIIGNCRDFTVLLTTILIHKGIPARARCGFAKYFTEGQYEDHWVCEFWNDTKQRWVFVDAQLDQLQQDKLNIKFDPCDVPQDQFLPAAKGWQFCKSGQADANSFGIFDMRGLWFIRGNMIRDIAALNKAELLPWDCWGLMNKRDNELSEQDLELLNRLADLVHANNEIFNDLRSLYLNDERLRLPKVIKSFRLEKNSFEEVEISGGFS